MLVRKVSDFRLAIPYPVARASWISSRSPWFSIWAASSSESPSTVPSDATMVIRLPLSSFISSATASISALPLTVDTIICRLWPMLSTMSCSFTETNIAAITVLTSRITTALMMNIRKNKLFFMKISLAPVGNGSSYSVTPRWRR